NLSNTEVYQPYGTFLWIVVLSPLLIAFIADKYGLLLLMALLVLMLLDQFIIKGFMNQQSYEIIHILNIIPYTITTTLLLYFVFDNAPPDRKGFYLGLYVFFVFFASTLSNYMIQVNKSTTLIIFIGSIIIIGLIQLFLHKKPANISKKH
ncbi:MAG: hypothetical protein ACQESZ_03305, partial [Bacteroidota bacterium]